MADFGRNFIDLFGNQAVLDLTAEVNRRLKTCDPDTAVGEVLYGLTFANPKACFDKTGSAWVSHAGIGEFGDVDQLCFKSDTDIPEKLENHLVWFYSKIDPNVVLRNMYDTEEGAFVGVRFKIVRDGSIFTFQRQLAIHDSVVTEIDDDSDDAEITWEEVWALQQDIGKEARRSLVTEYPFTEKLIPYL